GRVRPGARARSARHHPAPARLGPRAAHLPVPGTAVPAHGRERPRGARDSELTSRGPGVRLRGHAPAAAAAGLLLLVGVGVVVLARGADTPSAMQMLVGRLHPLAVHLPIGFLLLAFVLELLSRVRGMRRIGHAIPAVLVLTSVGAVGAALAGYLLAVTG